MRYHQRLSCLATFAGVVYAAPAMALNLVAPIGAANGCHPCVGGDLALSDMDYEMDDAAFGGDDDFSVDRTLLTGEIAYALSPRVDLLGQAGFIADSDIDGVDPDGKGFIVGVGVRGLAYQSGRMRVSPYGLLSYQSESYDDDDYNVEMTTHDLHVGGVVSFAVNDVVHPYGGVELVPISDGEVEVSVGRVDFSEDVEREDPLNLKVGSEFLLDALTMRAEATVIGESTMLASVGSRF